MAFSLKDDVHTQLVAQDFYVGDPVHTESANLLSKLSYFWRDQYQFFLLFNGVYGLLSLRVHNLCTPYVPHSKFWKDHLHREERPSTPRKHWSLKREREYLGVSRDSHPFRACEEFPRCQALVGFCGWRPWLSPSKRCWDISLTRLQCWYIKSRAGRFKHWVLQSCKWNPMDEQFLPHMKETTTFPSWRREFKELKNDILWDETKVEGILHHHPLGLGSARW